MSNFQETKNKIRNHTIFMGVVYAVLLMILAGLGLVTEPIFVLCVIILMDSIETKFTVYRILLNQMNEVNNE